MVALDWMMMLLAFMSRIHTYYSDLARYVPYGMECMYVTDPTDYSINN